MAKKKSKTIVQPDQYELFAKIRARFADMGSVGTISFLLTTSIAAIVAATLFSTAEDFWFRPPLLLASLALLVVAALAVFVEFSRSMRWIEHKDLLAVLHGTAILGTFGVLGWMFWQQLSMPKERALQRAEAARIKAAKADEAECQKQRIAEIQSTTKRQSEIRALLQRCKNDFERSRTIFTTETVEQHCRPRRASLAVAQRDLDAASSKICSTSSK